MEECALCVNSQLKYLPPRYELIKSVQHAVRLISSVRGLPLFRTSDAGIAELLSLHVWFNPIAGRGMTAIIPFLHLFADETLQIVAAGMVLGRWEGDGHDVINAQGNVIVPAKQATASWSLLQVNQSTMIIMGVLNRNFEAVMPFAVPETDESSSSSSA